MKIIGLLAMIIMFTSLASATTTLQIYIDQSGDALFIGETNETIVLPSGVDSFEGKISGYTSTLTSKNGELWTFVLNVPGSELEVQLPPGATLLTTSGGEIHTNNNQIVIVGKNALEITYTLDELPTQDARWILIVVPIGIIALIVLAYFLVKRKKSEKKKKVIARKDASKKVDKLSIIHQVLNDREKTIVETLRTTGKIKSSHVRKLSAIPKASFSRHIHELEKKGVVKLSGEGKNKFVELT